MEEILHQDGRTYPLLRNLLQYFSSSEVSSSRYQNKTKSTTQDCQQKHHLKFAYLDLPGHPFYGQKVQIIQEGRTDTMAWCLIAHPTQEGFHYRISKRWLCQKAPDKHLKQSQSPCHNPIPLEVLEKLAIFLKTLSRNDDRDRKGKGETKEEKKGKAHLGKFTDTEEARSGRKALLCNHVREGV